MTYNGIAYNAGGNVGSRYSVQENFGNRPVVYVSWYGAVAYCNWKSEQDGLQKCYGDYQLDGLGRWGTNGANYHPSNTGYRLPNEAEWEYACRGNPVQYTSYYWGDTIDGNYCWYNVNSSGNHHDVGTRLANNLGLYDMSGNIFEWCTDWFGDYGAGPDTNPFGPLTGTNRIERGGSWGNIAGHSRSAVRGYDTPNMRYDHTGFRVARTY